MSTPSARPSSVRRRPDRVSGEEREAAILRTLGGLLAERSIHDISVDDLARGAGISRPTFYFYFASKEAALLALLEELVERTLSAQEEAPQLLETDAAAAWRLALSASLETWIEHRHVIRAAAELRTSNTDVQRLWNDLLSSYVEQTAEVIEAERARGVAAHGVPARDLAICLNRMNERVYESMLGDGPLSLEPDRALDALVQVWLRAIYGPEGVPA